MTRSLAKRSFTACLALGLALFSLALLRCGGGGGGDTAPAPSTAITGSVSGTIVMAVDETGAIAARDDTAGRSPIDNTAPPRYRFSLSVPRGHQYHLFFIVGPGTPSEKIVPLSFGTTNVFAVGSASSIDFGFVDTSGAQATAEKSPFSVSGVTPGPQTGPPTIRVEGYRYFLLLDNHDNLKRYRVQLQVKDAAGNALAEGSLAKAMKVYGPSGAELAPDGSSYYWDGTGLYFDGGGGIAFSPTADVEMYLAASPGSLSPGFYSAAVTDSNGNLYLSTLYHGTPAQVGKPSGLSQTVNQDNSVTLSWTNPAGISNPANLVYVYVLHDDENGDGLQDNPLIVSRPVPTNSYTIPAGFVQTVLSGKTGLKWMVEIRQQTTSPVVFPDGSSSTAHFYRNRSAQATLTLPAQAVAFTQADLTGTWDIHEFQSSTSGGSGWVRAVVTFSGTGTLTVNSFEDSWGTIFPPGPTSTVWAVSSSGVITETDSSIPTSFHGNMASNKQLIVGTSNSAENNADKEILIVRKRVPGVSFSNSDLYGKSFAVHELYSGSVNGWNQGAGTIDSSGMVNATLHESNGSTDPISVGPISLDANGVATIGGMTNFKGAMTADKNILFGTNTGTVPSLIVITISGQTFTQADLAGVWKFHDLGSGTQSYWAYGTISVDGTGVGTFSGINTSSGPEPPGPPVTLSINSGGEIFQSGAALFHGSMSSGKNFFCATDTNSPGNYHLILSVK